MRAALMVLLQQNCLLVRTAMPEGGPGTILAAQTLYQVDILSILDHIRYALTPDTPQIVCFVGSRMSMMYVHVSNYCSILGRYTVTSDVWIQLQHLHPCNGHAHLSQCGWTAHLCIPLVVASLPCVTCTFPICICVCFCLCSCTSSQPAICS